VSPEAQRIAIAEACGWVEIKSEVDWLPNLITGLFTKPHLTKPGKVKVWITRREIPDYLNDLNALHAAEKVLLSDDATYSQRNFYASLLGSITLNDNGRGWQPLSNDDCFPILHATAAQRAEAFLRTLNLWTDDQ
jgi:hypothetical protein